MNALFCKTGLCENHKLNAYFVTLALLAIAYVLVRVALLFPSATLAVSVTFLIIAGLLTLGLLAITTILGDWKEAWKSITRR